MKKDDEDGIYEAIKVREGKCIYCVKYVQDGNKLFLSIRNGEIYFESNDYSFSDYPTFNLNNESHKLAKEVFINQLKTDIKTKILQLKQLESILNEMGLQGLIEDDIQKGGIFLAIKKKILGDGKNE